MTHSSSLVMRRYSIEPRTRKCVKGYGFLLFTGKYKKQLLNIEKDSLKTVSKQVVHKAGEFVGNKTVGAVTKLSGNKIVRPDKEMLKK